MKSNLVRNFFITIAIFGAVGIIERWMEPKKFDFIKNKNQY